MAIGRGQRQRKEAGLCNSECTLDRREMNEHTRLLHMLHFIPVGIK